MSFVCAPQLTGLVRGTPKEGAKHRANGKAICEEAGNERYSRSVTLDRSRSHLNKYDGYTSGGKCWEAMETQADVYRMKVKGKGGVEHERPLRSDAVIGWAVIFNPPAEATVGWTSDDYERFSRDSLDALEAIEPRLFGSKNLRMTAIHKDEGMPDEYGEFGQHLHAIGDAIDQEGRYCGNLMDARLISRINLEYPALMRKRGWDMEDIDQTDYYRMGKNDDGTYRDPEYRAARKVKRAGKRAGRSVNKYVADVTREAYEDAEAAYAQAQEEKNKARHEYVVADTARRKAEQEIEKRRAEAEIEIEAHRTAQNRAADADREKVADELGRAQRAAKTLESGLDGLDYYQGLVEFARTRYRNKDGKRVSLLEDYEKQAGVALTADEAKAAMEAAEAERQKAAEAIREAQECSERAEEKKRLKQLTKDGDLSL